MFSEIVMSMECRTDSRKWYWFILADFSVYFGGLLLIILWKIFQKFCCHRKISKKSTVLNKDNPYQSQLSIEDVADEYTFFIALRFYANQITSSQYVMGKILAVVSTLAAALSTILYLFEIIELPLLLERCSPMRNPIFCADLVCNIIFFIHFILRFITSTEKVKFWLGFYAVIDVFTITQIFTSVVLGQEWYGLRFLRILALMRVPEIMQCFNIVRSGTSIRIIQLLVLFLSILIVGAGFFHLLENSGDIIFENTYNNTQILSYGESLYFIVVTLSTVGYGDICSKTVCGRIFVTLFILLVLAAFASFIPELAEFLFGRSQYLGSYIKEVGIKHVVVCGHINYESVNTFLTDFLHEDREARDIEVVFINKKEPDIEMKNLLKIFYTQVKYFQGTVMNQEDLNRIQLSSADACLILANQNSLDPYDEDAGNILRAISSKNYSHRCPVIIQLLQFENKTYLENIPTWSKKNGDQIICYCEIELGILAQSCMVPGFSTFITNIFSVRSEKECKQSNLNEAWLNDYMKGVTMEIYSAKLSNSFEDFSYHELVEFCFKNLNLLLIAIEIPDETNNKSILLINPLNCKRISNAAIGFFICDSFKDAIKASMYCSKCHAVIRDLINMKACTCKQLKDNYNLTLINRIKSEEALLMKYDAEADFNELGFIDGNGIQNKGDLYICSPQKLLKCVITNEHQTESMKGHIILCIFSDDKTSVIGLKNFLMPLRSTSIPVGELKELLIIVDKNFIEKEWPEICCFPKIKIVFYEISLPRLVHLIAIDRCSRCVLLNSKLNFTDLQNDAYMMDKEIVIANLYFQAESRRRITKGKLNVCPEPIQQNDSLTMQQDISKPECVQLEMETTSEATHVPIISKLAIESNVQYLEVKEDNSTHIPNYLRKPFAFGYAFTTCMLDSLLSTAYYNPNSINIMQMLIDGGNSYESESEKESDFENSNNQFKINLLPVTEINKTVNWENNVFYRDIFLESLQTRESVCLGLYRKKNLTVTKSLVNYVDRYVITNPAANFVIHETDMVYSLQQRSIRSNNNILTLFNVERK